MGPRLILASTSPYRRAQLDRLGVPFLCRAPAVDEDACKRAAEGLDPRTLARHLAEAKSTFVEDEEDDLILGGDQLLALDGEILGKPGGPDRAFEQLRRLAGRSHELITALAVRHPDGVVLHVDVAMLRMRPLDDAAIARYLDADRPWDCAGSYKLESRGIALFERIVADDHSAITGLPLIALTTILRDLGWTVP